MSNISAEARNRSWMTNSREGFTESTAMTIRVQLPWCRLLTSSSGGARPAFLPALLLPRCLCKRPSVSCQFLPRSLFTSDLSLLCVCVCVCVCVTVTCVCVSALPSERHTNRWGVERPRAILWQKRFPSFVPRADGTDGLSTAQSRPEGGRRPSVPRTWASPVSTAAPPLPHPSAIRISSPKFENSGN